MGNSIPLLFTLFDPMYSQQNFELERLCLKFFAYSNEANFHKHKKQKNTLCVFENLKYKTKTVKYCEQNANNHISYSVCY
jgi:hypothetical protein